MRSEVNIFEVIDPPAGAEAVVNETIAAIRFPWRKVMPYLRRQGVTSVKIRFGAPEWMSNTTSGNWSVGDNTIYLSTQFSNWLDEVPFVLTHEIGHLIDTAVLNDRQRRILMRVFHNHPDFSVPPTLTHDGLSHPERWSNGSAPYPARIYECWADEFVATFAPTVWDGTVTEAASQHWPRFVHWSDSFRHIKRIVLHPRLCR